MTLLCFPVGDLLHPFEIEILKKELAEIRRGCTFRCDNAFAGLNPLQFFLLCCVVVRDT